MTMSVNVPESIVLRFLRDAEKALRECKIDTTENHKEVTLDDCRDVVLATQRSCLDKVIKEFNDKSNDERKFSNQDGKQPQHQESFLTPESVQQELKRLKKKSESCTEVKLAMENLDDAARLSFCRLVLYSEYIREIKQQLWSLKTSGFIEKSEVLEFCGLCNGVLRLDFVKKHLSDGTPLFHDDEYISTLDKSASQAAIPMFPTKRLEKIQEMLLRAVGYDADYGKAELKRFFETPVQGHDDAIETFSQTCSNIRNALTNASIRQAEGSSGTMFSDKNSGGVTSVVSVTYSEKDLDPNESLESQLRNAADGSSQVPHHQSMESHVEDAQRKQLQIARDAATLQQQILQELESMTILQRTQTLKAAEEAEQSFMQQAMQIPVGPERITFLRSIDPSTQRLLAMKKIWAATNK